MEELQLLIHTIAGLPALTVWVLGGYLIYKLAVLGSLYGTIRYLADKFVEWRTKPQETTVTKEFNLQGIAITEGIANGLVAQICRIARSGYIHSPDLIFLRDALDEAFIKKESAK